MKIIIKIIDITDFIIQNKIKKLNKLKKVKKKQKMKNMKQEVKK